MTVTKKKLLYSGKAKSMYETDDPNLLITDFRDDTSAFNGVKKQALEDKGKVNNRISSYIMQKMAEADVPTHFIEKLSDHETLVKRLQMIPLEGVVRNIAAGSLSRRLGIQEGIQLDPPVFEFFLKSDELGDPMINRNHAVVFGWATEEQLKEIEALCYKVNEVLTKLLADVNLVLVDAKFEFGVDADGKIHLADEISPDSCRIWEKDTHEILDKDRFRKDLGNVIESYKIIAGRLGC